MFQSFDSFEDMVAAMAANEAAANARVTPAQAAIRDQVSVTHYVKFQDRNFGVWIYGEVRSLQETLAAERAFYDADESDEDREELEDIERRLTDSRSRGYLFGTWFS